MGLGLRFILCIWDCVGGILGITESVVGDAVITVFSASELGTMIHLKIVEFIGSFFNCVVFKEL